MFLFFAFCVYFIYLFICLTASAMFWLLGLIPRAINYALDWNAERRELRRLENLEDEENARS